MKAVRINELVKKFDDIIAVDKISIDINEGEIYGLLGPNGAGKSTTINILTGLLKSDSGTVEILGEDIFKSKDTYKRHIGVVPQDIAIYSDLSAEENVRFFAGLYGLRGKELKEKTEYALDFVGLSDRKKEFSKNFSGGMKRRLNIACAIAHQPKIIFMDEPTVGIDPQSRNHILSSIKTLNKLGSTIIYTTHYMEEADSICSRIGIIDHGKLIAEGSSDDLKNTICDEEKIEIKTDINSSVNKSILENISGVKSVTLSDTSVMISYEKEANILDQIIQYFSSNSIQIKGIHSKTPDLETVFLTLTGRKLRD